MTSTIICLKRAYIRQLRLFQLIIVGGVASYIKKSLSLNSFFCKRYLQMF